MVCVPTPAEEGEKFEPFIPGPVYVPPDGEPIKSNGLSVEQTVFKELVNVTVGLALTEIVCVYVSLPKLLVTVKLTV